MDINHIRNSLQKKGWYFCLFEAYKRVFPLKWVRDQEIIAQIHDKRAYSYLKKKYMPMLNEFEPEKAGTPCNRNKTIWVCWLQGEKNAPEIVKRCLASIRQHAGQYEVCLITNDNIDSYITIPSYISDRLRKRQMQYATYSDYIRMALLEKHGGIWIDATVFLSSNIPDTISDSPLFFFQKPCLSSTPMVLSSWFLVSEPHNRIVQQTKYLFERYWQKENKLRNYYLFHLLFSIVVNFDEQNRIATQSMPYWNNVDVHYLQSQLFNPFNESLFKQICEKEFAHKLTYKFQNMSNLTLKDTYYQHLIHS